MPKTFEVTRLVDGLNFGEGNISKDERLHSDEDPLDIETIKQLEEALESRELIVPIGADGEGNKVEDDGCGDGRPVSKVFRGLHKLLERSLHRAKVFGGGLAMTASTKIGMGKAKGRALQSLFSDTKDELEAKGLDYGAHTDSQANGENCGCGAIDKAPGIIQNATFFRDQIASVVDVLTAGKHEHEYLATVQDSFAEYADEIQGQPYSGKQVANEILDKDKIVKELEGDHKETHIVINTIPGTTVDQEFIRVQTDGHAQVFAVDEWRLRELSVSLHKNPEDQEKAYLSMLVYTLATAGTLTKGDLPVYVVTGAADEAILEPAAA